MSSRRSSDNRPRGWSSASFETNEDIVVFGGNINSANIVKPDRQPVNPPSEIHTGKETGFARFLKKHSSPTHNRVTAGGRIVPMEKRGSPPRFDLSASACPAAQTEIYSKQEMVGPSHLVGMTDRQQDMRCYQSAALASTINIKQHLNTETAAGSAAATDGISHTASGARLPSRTVDSTGIVPQSVLTNHFNAYVPETQPQNGLGYFASQVPYFPVQSSMSYPGYTWSFPDTYMAVLNAAANFHLDPQVQMVFSTNQMIMDAEALFNNLDRQLKLIDRHRAMNSHDPNLSSQRMAIVQQRAEAKDTIHRLKAQLRSEHGPARSQGRMSFGSAMSPAFVPAVMKPVEQTVASPASTSNTTVKVQAAADNPHQTTKRNPIPIVPPPPTFPAQAEPCKKNTALPAGKPSMKEEETQQSSLSEEAQLSCNAEKAESSSSKTSVTPQQGITNDNIESETMHASTESNTKQVDSQKAQGAFDQTEWMEMQTGETPAKVEAIYELQLDAMRLPEGANVLIPLSEGTVVSVPGSKLGRPLVSLMSDFEKEYWDRKPTYTIEMLENLKARATIKDLGDVLTDEYLVTNADGPPASPIKATSNETKHEERVQRYIENQSNRLKEYAPLSHVSTKSEVSVAYDTAGHDSPVVAAEVTIANVITGPRTEEGLRSDSESIMFDEMSHKGFSSVSTQNINVQVQFPPPGFDGTTEARRRSAAMSSLAAASKQRSPRLLHRSTPNGSA